MWLKGYSKPQQETKLGFAHFIDLASLVYFTHFQHLASCKTSTYGYTLSTYMHSAGYSIEHYEKVTYSCERRCLCFLSCINSIAITTTATNRSNASTTITADAPAITVVQLLVATVHVVAAYNAM